MILHVVSLLTCRSFLPLATSPSNEILSPVPVCQVIKKTEIVNLFRSQRSHRVTQWIIGCGAAVLLREKGGVEKGLFVFVGKCNLFIHLLTEMRLLCAMCNISGMRIIAYFGIHNG